jgi:hypothetical protein
VASDNFIEADQAPPAGWTQDSDLTDVVKVVSHQCTGTSNAVGGLIYFAASSVASSQCVITGSLSGIGPAIHCDGAGNGYFYSAGGALLRYDSGVPTALAITGSGGTTGDTVLINRSGGNVLALLNGTQVMSAADSTYTGGHPGIAETQGPFVSVNMWTDGAGGGTVDEDGDFFQFLQAA